ncbi:MAG: hypothetical protein AAGH79_07760 [Bacteroidota bacterium]
MNKRFFAKAAFDNSGEAKLYYYELETNGFFRDKNRLKNKLGSDDEVISVVREIASLNQNAPAPVLVEMVVDSLNDLGYQEIDELTFPYFNDISRLFDTLNPSDKCKKSFLRKRGQNSVE